MNKRHKKEIPFQLDRAVIEVNGKCNYRCQMCPQTDPGRDKGFLTKMSLLEFEDNVRQCAEAGVRVINLEGSGEPTTISNLVDYINICKKYNTKVIMFSNGLRMHGDYMKQCVDAGVDMFRFSIIGCNAPQYTKWMNRNTDDFHTVINNMHRMHDYVERVGSDCIVAAYHLITDDLSELEQVCQYLAMHSGFDNLKYEIWKMHNWSGIYDNKDKRSGQIKTCGRPFTPDIVIRAGGIDGLRGAVAPCCQVLGRDEEAVLGHTSVQTVREIWNDEPYQLLREQHMTGDYPDYCKDCDFLIDDPEVLVLSNYDDQMFHMHGTEFNINDYR